MVFLLMAPQSEDTVRSTSISSSSIPFWLVQAFSLPSFACSSISSSERESKQAHHLSHFSLYHPSSHPPILKTHLHSNTFHSHSNTSNSHSNTTILIPIPSILISLPPIFIPIPLIVVLIPPSSFQYHQSVNISVIQSQSPQDQLSRCEVNCHKLRSKFNYCRCKFHRARVGYKQCCRQGEATGAVCPGSPV